MLKRYLLFLCSFVIMYPSFGAEKSLTAIPTVQSEIVRPTVFQILFENNQLLQRIAHDEARTLLCTNTYCKFYMQRYHKANIDSFNTQHKKIEEQLPKPIVMIDHDSEIHVYPESVRFDASSNCCRGYGIRYNSNIQKKELGCFIFSYPICTIQSEWLSDTADDFYAAITTPTRSLSFTIIRSTNLLENRGFINTWNKREIIALPADHTMLHLDKNDPNTIIYQGRSYDHYRKAIIRYRISQVDSRIYIASYVFTNE